MKDTPTKTNVSCEHVSGGRRPTGRPWPANLRRRPFAPATGRGRIQTAVRRAFLGHTFRTGSQVYDYALAREQRRGFVRRNRWSVVRVLLEVAVPVGVDRAHGAIIWRLKDGHKCGQETENEE